MKRLYSDERDYKQFEPGFKDADGFTGKLGKRMKVGIVALLIAASGTAAFANMAKEQPEVSPNVFERVRFYSGPGQLITGEDKARELAKWAQDEHDMNINIHELGIEINRGAADANGYIQPGSEVIIGFDTELGRVVVYSDESQLPEGAVVGNVIEDFRKQADQ